MIKGRSAEKRVQNALDWLKENEQIDEITRSQELERKGVDFQFRRGSKSYKLSVKSSEGGILSERDRHPERHRHEDILFILPTPEETRESLAGRIIEGATELERRMHGAERHY
jgi:hypothetical protein